MGMQLVETVELTSTTSGVGFTSIPQDGQDLMVLVSARSDGGTIQLYTRFNGATTGFNTLYLYGNGSSVFSNDRLNSTRIDGYAIPTSSYTANTFSNIQMYVPNYTSSEHKTVSYEGVSENNSTTAYSAIVSGLWANTSAVSSITFQVFSDGLVAGSTLSLYKITAD